MDFENTDEQILELLSLMDEFNPMIPDAVAEYFLNKNGIECDDLRLKKLLSLITQKFVTDVCMDALQHNRVRQREPSTKRKEKKTTLTMEDLQWALSERGIKVKRPPYYM